MNKNQLLREQVGRLDEYRPVVFQGVVQTAGVFGQNNRNYTIEAWRQALVEYQERVVSQMAYGMLDHQYDFKLQDVSHMVREIRVLDNGTVIAEMWTLPTPKGQILANLLESLDSIGVSTTAYPIDYDIEYEEDGSERITINNFFLLSIDAVALPSYPEAIMKRVEGAHDDDEKDRYEYNGKTFDKRYVDGVTMKLTKVEKKDAFTKEGLDTLAALLLQGEANDNPEEYDLIRELSLKIGVLTDIMSAYLGIKVAARDSDNGVNTRGTSGLTDDELDALSTMENKILPKDGEEPMNEDKMIEALQKDGKEVVTKEELAHLKAIKENVEKKERADKLSTATEMFGKLKESLGDKMPKELTAENFISGDEDKEAAMKLIGALNESLNGLKEQLATALKANTEMKGVNGTDITTEGKGIYELADELAKKDGRKFFNDKDIEAAQKLQKN